MRVEWMLDENEMIVEEVNDVHELIVVLKKVDEIYFDSDVYRVCQTELQLCSTGSFVRIVLDKK